MCQRADGDMQIIEEGAVIITDVVISFGAKQEC